MENIESMRMCEGNGKVVRLFSTFLLDSSWYPNGWDFSKTKDYAVITYKKDDDRLVPNPILKEQTGSSWVADVSAEMEEAVSERVGTARVVGIEEAEIEGKVIEEPIEESVDDIQMTIARGEFKKKEKEWQWFDDFDSADAAYRTAALKKCGVVEIPYAETLFKKA
jgi:hypothetical protein